MKKTSHTGIGIVMGAASGMTFGLLFGDGNFIWGIFFGTGLGLVIGAIFDTRAGNIEDKGETHHESD